MAEAQMPKNLYWNQTSKRWEMKGRAKGSPIFYANDTGFGGPNIETTGVASLADARVERLRVGGGTISLMTKLTGTLPAINVGTNGYATGTLTGMGSIGVAVNDLLIPVVRAGGLVAGVGLDECWAPTTNVINIKLNNVSIASAGSQTAIGVDVLQIRSA